MDKKDEQKDGNGSDKNQTMIALAVVGNLIYTIAIPIVLFTLLGKYLDNETGKKFTFILAGGGIGILVGMWGVYKKAEELKNRVYGENKNSSNKK
ncbi:AtpZ/AtpI family protein [Candidatus Kuenenbacteria bacterium]|nr:AtpZ/AtpI family protein [Candidatus Kuenenbacteria bacterium]